MHISIRWLNQYLEPGNVTTDEAEHILMNVGFPAETKAPVPVGDTCVDFEITSNRGDCLSHLGLAREIAAKSGRALRIPAAGPVAMDAQPASSFITLSNPDHAVCPLFTARVIRGCKVAPSPAWLRTALEAVGQRSISNVVDVTNFIAFEFGNPCHVFDLAKLEGGTIVVRFAKDKEELTTLDGKKRTLAKDELVVADAHRATSLAGVIGGFDSQVTDSTTDIVFEMATWDPVTVRRAARRHQVRTDASHRFERIVDARTIDIAADRAAKLIADLTGGRLCPGVVSAGAPLQPLTTIRLRPERVHSIMGIAVPADEIVRILVRLGIDVGPLGRGGEDFLCTVPPHRPDLTREIDLIEEIARVHGLDKIPILDKLPVAVKSPQTTELARREIASVLTGMGFYEAVTFSFTTPAMGAKFTPTSLRTISIDDARRGEEPTLRPSVISGLLASRRANAHAGNAPEGGVRLFETAAVFAETGDAKSPQTIEHRNLGLLLDCPMKGTTATLSEVQTGLRLMRGVIEALVRATHGPNAQLDLTPSTSPASPAIDAPGFASITLAGQPLGYLGVVEKSVLTTFELTTPAIAAELNLPALLAGYPPKSAIAPLPQFPGIERDLSIIVAETVSWDAIRAIINKAPPEKLERVGFVYSYRGKPFDKGKKSITLRLAFRDPARTLRHDEIDGPVAAIAAALKAAVAAEVRGLVPT
jgi:phenylalanyl-tRNA synthetase beta chain